MNVGNGVRALGMEHSTTLHIGANQAIKSRKT